MTLNPKKNQAIAMSAAMMPNGVDVDLVRFEKNLLQIGFFGANDARDKNRTTRRVEQVVVRNGSKIKVAAEFRGSEALGLPSTTDRDKFIALLKIMSEERLKTGSISNPVRFSGYRLIQELGLARNGEIYEEILKWGKRMTDTTITSEHVVYRAAKKVYSDETLHVFRAFRRTGNSNLDGSERQENFEIVLEDWLLENLNQRYVVPEDFNAYKQLTRPTAKGIFGNLHLWFHASSGKPVEKDYADLCNLLNIQAYLHLSKIKSTIGLSLNELVSIKYLSSWDVQKMSSKQGYKIVLIAGDELLRVLDATRPERREVSPALPAPTRDRHDRKPLNQEEQRAVELLKQHGVLSSKAESLVRQIGCESVLDTVEYLAATALAGRRKSVENPAGLIIYSLENGLPVPATFMSSRRQRAMDEARERESTAASQRELEYFTYQEWLESEQDRVIRSQFSQAELDLKFAELVQRLTQSDERFRTMPEKGRLEFARRMLRKDLASEVTLPGFDEWRSSHVPTPLFN